jgi:hypothetical protein
MRMSKTILLKHHQVFVKSHVRRDVYKEEGVNSLAPYLQLIVEEVVDFTFGDLWRLIEKDRDFYEKVFKEAMGGWPLEPFMKDAASYHERQEEDVKFRFIEIIHRGEINDYSKDEELSELGVSTTIYEDIYGIGTGDDGTGKVAQDIAWSLSFRPISELMDIPLRLNEEFKLYLTVNKSGKSFERSAIDGGRYGFSVYQILEAVLDEITFHGAPTDRSATLADMDQKVAEIKNGTAKMKPLDFDRSDANNDEDSDHLRDDKNS